jgi:hypothetical protein
MTQLLSLSGASVASTIWAYGHRPLRGDDLGTLSAQWLHDYRLETHQDR